MRKLLLFVLVFGMGFAALWYFDRVSSESEVEEPTTTEVAPDAPDPVAASEVEREDATPESDPEVAEPTTTDPPGTKTRKSSLTGTQ